MTTFYLIRHGHTDAIGRGISGRQAGVHLSQEGRQQAQALADWLAGQPIGQLFASPLDRTQETAAFLAERLGLAVQTAEELIELDFGDWTGKEFREVKSDPLWKRFNTFRSGTQIPGGESMLDVQSRLVRFLQRLRAEYPEDAVALVTHGDCIRAAVCYWLAVPVDLLHRIETSLAAVTIIRVDQYGPLILAMNATPRPWAG